MTSENIAEYRAEIRRFLDDNLPADWAGTASLNAEERRVFVENWRRILHENRMVALAWPEEYGGSGLSIGQQSALQDEFSRRGVSTMPVRTDGFSVGLIGNTILAWGTEEQKRHYLPRILSGEDRWCQGYSEPDAGSDLFNARTKAELVDGQWIINGQKCWQTAGDDANWIFVLVRTEPNAAKSKGLSLLLVPIDQPGVTVRPILSMTGEAEFCEVFFDNAVTDAANIVGPRAQGAKVALTLLGFERGSATESMATNHRLELDRLVELARNNGRLKEPGIRQRLAWAYSKVEIIRYIALTTLERTSAGQTPGPESSILKLYGSEYHARVTELAMDILGAEAMTETGGESVAELGPEPWGANNSPATWQHTYMTARAAVIYGGSSQIQRNTLGEYVLGLPREPRPVEVSR